MDKPLYVEGSIYMESEELVESLNPYYDMILAAKKSVYTKIIHEPDPSPEALKKLIFSEANSLQKVNEALSIGIGEKEVKGSLRSMYKMYRRSTESNDNPPFFHLNLLRKDGLEARYVAFYSTSFKFSPDYEGILVGSDFICIPQLHAIVKSVEKDKSCKLHRLAFKHIGPEVIDNHKCENLTQIFMKFEML